MIVRAAPTSINVANGTAVFKPPPGGKYVLRGVSYNLVTSATAANRQPYLDIKDSAGYTVSRSPADVVAANFECQITWADNAGPLTRSAWGGSSAWAQLLSIGISVLGDNDSVEIKHGNWQSGDSIENAVAVYSMN